MKFLHISILIIFLGNLSFGQKVEFSDNSKNTKSHLYSQNSVLNNGTWYKISAKYDGVYIITYNDLVQNGIDVSTVNPENFRIYGNINGMLPESNSVNNIDDLIEKAIYVEGESDGNFDPDDYILFYGESPVKWKFDSLQNIFTHTLNYYSDETFYFLTYDIGAGKRIQVQPSSNLSATNVVTKFNDYLFHEKDSLNLLASGKEWYGEHFEGESSHNFFFSFPDINIYSEVKIITNIAARNVITTKFEINANGNSFNIDVNPISEQYTSDYARFSIDTMSFFPTASDLILNINEKTSGSLGWLNYIDINVMRNLNFSGKQMGFRNTESIGTGNIAEFKISNPNNSIKIWEITDPFNIKEQAYIINGAELNFKIPLSSLKQFQAFDGTFYYTPSFKGKVANQNLHSIEQADMIIITYPDFITQANRLAQIHSTYDNFNIIVTTPEKIYNEFSSGSQDVSAIRNFVRMLYERTKISGNIPKYLLLFGDGSYDYKNRIPGNTNFVPTYESLNSLLPTLSFLTDDFYGIVDSIGGYYSNGKLEVGIGRLPAKTNAEAKAIVDKIENYIKKLSIYNDSNGCTTYSNKISGNWRNIGCFIADDEDNNLHINQAEDIAKMIDTTYNNINIKKIYLDAYK
ncbi:MAG: type IX secretion system sortase PorU, partial [Bacteroidetes bacterium]|nr:type IX secretion system sortase PorU [Bacteroidota bacterium]